MMTRLLAAAVALAAVSCLSAAGAADLTGRPGADNCAGIADDGERLACYDRLAGGPAADNEAPSRLSRLWQLDRYSRRSTFAITPYRLSYFLPYTYNTTPNEAPVKAADPGRSVQNKEFKFQISFKTKLWQDVLGRNVDLWAGYTQISFWQFYNFEGSAPFRETNYEPEAMLVARTDYRVLGLRGRYVNLAFNHQSNGQTRPLSRSWNRIMGGAGFERGGFVLVLNGWYRLPEDDSEDDNPGIERFVGYGQVNADYVWGNYRLGVFLRNNLRSSGNKGAVQVDFCFPLIPRMSGYVQYFNGYAESLLDFNASSNRIGIGAVLKEW